MSESMDYPAGGTPPDPNWTWWNALAGARPQQQPQLPSLVEMGALRPFDSLEALAAVLAERLAGRQPVLTRTVATIADHDSFPAWSVYARADGAERASAAVYIGCAAIQRTAADLLEAALAAAARRPAAKVA